MFVSQRLPGLSDKIIDHIITSAVHLWRSKDAPGNEQPVLAAPVYYVLMGVAHPINTETSRNS